MKRLKSSISDYFIDFKLKSAKEKAQALKRHVIQGIIAMLLICSPFFLNTLHHRLQIAMHMQEIEQLPLSEKWKLIAHRYAHLECTADAGAGIRDGGFDPKTQEGLNYAIERGLCNVIPNDDAEFTTHWQGTKPLSTDE